MKKIFLILAVLLVAFSGFAVSTPPHLQKTHVLVHKKETYVYICNSSGAYAYHSSKNCRGLNRCTHEILKVTLSDAIKIYKRKPCKICE
ncbi:MAG TPA: hypothetical protein VGM31_05550 [Puia sp.]|jgi:hypothetical protein